MLHGDRRARGSSLLHPLSQRFLSFETIEQIACPASCCQRRCDNLVHLRGNLSYAAKSALYRVYQALNRGIKIMRRAAGLKYWSLASTINESAEFAKTMIDNFERAVAQEAKALGYDGADALEGVLPPGVAIV